MIPSYTIVVNVRNSETHIRIPVRSLGPAKKAAIGIWGISDREKVEGVHVFEGQGVVGDRKIVSYDS